VLNRATIIGRLGRDPEIRHMPNGDAVCNFTVATSKKWKDKASGELKEETTWHRLSAWGRDAEIIGKYLRKGSLAYFEGEIVNRKYTDKDGQEKESREIRVQEVKLLGERDASSPAPSAAQRGPASAPPAPRQSPAVPSGFDDMEDDIPF